MDRCSDGTKIKHLVALVGLAPGRDGSVQGVDVILTRRYSIKSGPINPSIDI